VYGTSTTATDAGDGSESVPSTAVLTGLAPGAEYHYRLAGTNKDGSSYGSSQTFKTNYADVVFVHPTDSTCGGNDPCHATIQEAIDAAATGCEIRLFGGTHPGTFDLKDAKILTISGRWNDAFNQQNGETTIIKAPKAPQGSLTLQNVNIVP